MARRKNIYSLNRQRLICLLFVLRELGGGPRKREVVEHIQRRGYLDIQPEDVDPYITQTEPRWCTDVAFRRKDGVQRDLLFNQTRDCWELTRAGRDLIDRIVKLFREKTILVGECFLWTKVLKKLIDPEYVPSELDAKRPRAMTVEEMMETFK
jgi:hypothetical protein